MRPSRIYGTCNSSVVTPKLLRAKSNFPSLLKSALTMMLEELVLSANAIGVRNVPSPFPGRIFKVTLPEMFRLIAAMSSFPSPLKSRTTTLPLSNPTPSRSLA